MSKVRCCLASPPLLQCRPALPPPTAVSASDRTPCWTGGGGRGGGGDGSSPSSRACLPRGVSCSSSPSLKEPRSCPSDKDDRESLNWMQTTRMLELNWRNIESWMRTRRSRMGLLNDVNLSRETLWTRVYCPGALRWLGTTGRAVELSRSVCTFTNQGASHTAAGHVCLSLNAYPHFADKPWHQFSTSSDKGALSFFNR